MLDRIIYVLVRVKVRRHLVIFIIHFMHSLACISAEGKAKKRSANNMSGFQGCTVCWPIQALIRTHTIPTIKFL